MDQQGMTSVNIESRGQLGLDGTERGPGGLEKDGRWGQRCLWRREMQFAVCCVYSKWGGGESELCWKSYIFTKRAKMKTISLAVM
jgi:hypothetical protein